MISLYSGTPGSGKSLHVAQYIYDRCRNKRVTIGNFDINRDTVKNPDFYLYWENSELDPLRLVEFSEEYFDFHKFKEGALLIVIDEAQLLFNAREWNVKGRSDWLLFFTQHRKLGYDIILIAQFDKMIDKQIRSLFEYEIIHRKVSNFGWKGKMLSIWSGNRLFIAVKMWYPLKEKVGSERFYYSAKLGEMYDTRSMFNKWKDSSENVSITNNSTSASDDCDMVFEVINF